MRQTAAIGVLDLQGGVQEHLDHFQRIGIAAEPVKQAQQFSKLVGLVIPGGESTCLARLLTIFGLRDAILNEHQRGLKLWGTCAGTILLARENIGESAHLRLIDLAVQRNAFGSQLDSFNGYTDAPKVAPHPIPLTFIRAPKIVRVGPDVEVLLRIEDYIAAAEDEQTLVTVFHPELTPSLAFHRYFSRKCGLQPLASETTSDTDPTWTRQSWTRIQRTHSAL